MGDVFEMLQDFLLGVTQWHILTYMKVLNQFMDNQDVYLKIYRVVGELDAAISTGSFRKSLPLVTVPEYEETKQLEMEEIYHKVNEMSDLTGYVPGFHAEYTCSKELLWKVSEMAHHYRTPVYAHISETEKEVEECKARYGMTPPMFLDSLGMFDFGGGGFHCVHVTEQDMDVFRRHRMYVITNPGSNTKLASGIAPIADYVRHKIPVAIGTDGPASNNCLDMFREMFLVTGLSKLLEKDASSMDAVEVLKMATVNGAKAMRLNRADVLAKGKYADLIMIDLHQPNMHPIHNIPKNLVYSGSKSNVCMTMIGGKILYRNGEFNVGENPERIYTKCEKIVKRLLTE